MKFVSLDLPYMGFRLPAYHLNRRPVYTMRYSVDLRITSVHEWMQYAYITTKVPMMYKSQHFSASDWRSSGQPWGYATVHLKADMDGPTAQAKFTPENSSHAFISLS
jgi:hypothetical protein